MSCGAPIVTPAIGPAISGLSGFELFTCSQAASAPAERQMPSTNRRRPIVLPRGFVEWLRRPQGEISVGQDVKISATRVTPVRNPGPPDLAVPAALLAAMADASRPRTVQASRAPREVAVQR